MTAIPKIVSPSFPEGLPHLRSENEVRGNVTMLQVIQAGAAAAVAADPRTPAPHPVADMPRCKWVGSHRYEMRDTRDGRVYEVCMDCETAARSYPVGSNSSHGRTEPAVSV